MSEVQTISIVSHEVKKGEAKPYVTYNVKGEEEAMNERLVKLS